MLPLSEKRTIKIELEINPCLNGFFDAVDVEFNINTKKTFVRTSLIEAWVASPEESRAWVRTFRLPLAGRHARNKVVSTALQQPPR